MIGDNPVDLLRHGVVERTHPRLDVGERHLHLRCDECPAQGRVGISVDQQRVWVDLGNQRLEPSDGAGSLLSVGSGTDSKDVIRGW